VNIGHFISGITHIGLISWALLNGSFQSEPRPFASTDVSLISTDSFEALLTSGPQPDTATDVASPIMPVVDSNLVETPNLDETVTLEVPELSPQPESEVPPEAPIIPITPVPEVVDVAPEAPQQQDLLTPTPRLVPQSIPRPSERVAPKAVAPPESETSIDLIEREEVTIDEDAVAKIEEQAATGPAEATTEIVTEAEKSVTAPLSSLRPPRQRPIVPAPTRTTKVLEPESLAVVNTPEGVNDALREALADGKAEIPTGPPLSVGEKDALRVAVSNCWNVGSLSSESLQVIVVVAFDMSRDGRPVAPSIRLVSSSGGSANGAKQAYEAARRAIIRCTKNGYKLPLEKYGQWKEIEITFNPERMRIK